MSPRKRKRVSQPDLEAAQRVTSERKAASVGVDPQDLHRVHKDMHPDPDMTIRQRHLERGDTIQFEDESLVLYTPTPELGKRVSQTQGVLHINFGAGEDFFETQVFRTIPFADLTEPPFEFKFLAKTRADGRVQYVFKALRSDGTMFMTATSQGWVTEENYRAHVAATLAQMQTISVVSEPTIQTQADYHRASARVSS